MLWKVLINISGVTVSISRRMFSLNTCYDFLMFLIDQGMSVSNSTKLRQLLYKKNFGANSEWNTLYILTFTFLDSRQDDKRLWTEW
jgi:hypothetical protein